jgi:hypothetical protein
VNLSRLCAKVRCVSLVDGDFRLAIVMGKKRGQGGKVVKVSVGEQDAAGIPAQTLKPRDDDTRISPWVNDDAGMERRVWH